MTNPKISITLDIVTFEEELSKFSNPELLEWLVDVKDDEFLFNKVIEEVKKRLKTTEKSDGLKYHDFTD